MHKSSGELGEVQAGSGTKQIFVDDDDDGDGWPSDDDSGGFVVEDAPSKTARTSRTTCPCFNEVGHPKQIVLNAILPGTIEKVLEKAIEPDFVAGFLRSRGVTDIDMAKWSIIKPYSRRISYNKTLEGSLGPKWTYCEVREEIPQSHYYEEGGDSVHVISSIKYPNVPYGLDFSVETRLCFVRHGEGNTRLVVTTLSRWTGRNSIDSKHNVFSVLSLDMLINALEVVDRWSLDDQKSYYEAFYHALYEAICKALPRFIPLSLHTDLVLEKCGILPEEIALDGNDPSSLNFGAMELEERQFGNGLKIGTANDLRSFLSADGDVEALLSLEGSMVPPLVDLLHAEIRTTASDPGLVGYRKKCAKCLRNLVNKHHVLPSSLFVNEVVKEGAFPLGGGGFSDIWKGSYGERSVCLKVLRVHIQGDQRKRDKVAGDFYKEALLWTQLGHPNLLPFIGVNTTLFPQGFCLVSPWMANGDIIAFLERNPDHDKLTTVNPNAFCRTLFLILLQILEIAAGMSYLHTHKIVHGDIKGANVLVNEQRRCHLADFGLAVTTAETTTLVNSTSTMAGSLRWMAPELFHLGDDAEPESATSGEGKATGSKFARDIYAFACTVLEVSYSSNYLLPE
ncbi:hypothetical protein V5O48_015023 [Marasmius crinis-equi]|uniref:Protein kinase domain-containing protein n=1 Tax=Marasmius crinis-equi TaxID=585013 RepID=A0ABR3EVP3_9AGAR